MVASLLGVLISPDGGISNRRYFSDFPDGGGAVGVPIAPPTGAGEPSSCGYSKELSVVELGRSVVGGRNSLCNELKKLIKKDKLHQMVDLLLDQPLNIVSESQKKDLLHYQGRIYRTSKEWKKKRFSPDDYQKFRNRERASLLELCEEILPELFK